MGAARVIALGACLLSGAALAVTAESNEDCNTVGLVSDSRCAGDAGIIAPLFSFASSTAYRGYPAYAGLPVASPICAALGAADEVGDWWCVDGDGTNASSIVMQTVADPEPAELRVCPNGPDCGAVPTYRFNGVSQYLADTTAVNTPDGDFSACALIRVDSFTPAYQQIVSKDSNAAGGRSFDFSVTSLESLRAVVYKTDGSSTTITAGNSILTLSAWHLVCIAYDYITDGTSVFKIYLDGAQVQTTSAAVGPAQANTIDYNVGRRVYVGSEEYFGGGFRGAFLTEKYLDAATNAALARSVLADVPTGTKGEALTYALSTRSSCPLDANESEISILPPNRPCITQGGIDIWRSRSNRAQYSDNFGNAAWTKGATGGSAALIVTEDQAVGPFGAVNADRIQVDACPNVGDSSFMNQNTGAGAGGQTLSIWLKGNASTPSVSICSYSYNPTVATCTPYTLTETWKRYKHQAATASIGTLFYLGCENEAVFVGSSNTGAADLFAFGAQLEVGDYASPYIRTLGGAATRNASTAAITTTLPYSTFSAAATHTRLPVAGQDMPWLSAGAGTDAYALYVSGGTTAVGWGKTSGGNTITTAAVTAVADARMYAVWLGTGSTNMPCYNGTCATPAAITGTPAATVGVIYLGYGGAGHALTGGYADGIVSNACWDSSTTRCR